MSRELLAALLLLFLLPLLLYPYLPHEEIRGDAGGPLGISARGVYTSYRVRPGDTLAGIARRYGIPLEYLQASNGIADPKRLRAGEVILLPRGGVLHVVKPGQSLEDISASYGVDPVEILEANGVPRELSPGQRILIPSPRTIPWLEALKLGWSPGATFVWPLKGRLTSLFGPRIHPIYHTPDFHTGIDLAVPVGTPVHAAAAGKVVQAGWQGGYGLLLVIDHGNGLSTYYGHLSEVLVRVGQFVEQGQVVARSGNTGLSTGPHLHFEIRRFGEPVDPLPWLP